MPSEVSKKYREVSKKVFDTSKPSGTRKVEKCRIAFRHLYAVLNGKSVEVSKKSRKEVFACKLPTRGERINRSVETLFRHFYNVLDGESIEVSKKSCFLQTGESSG